jgi:hypothetical protein
MRKMVLLASCMAALSGTPAMAQIMGTGDVSRDSTQIIMWMKQQADNMRQIQQAIQQYQLLNRTYESISHATDISGVAYALGGVTRTYLPDYSQTLSAIGQGSRLVENAARVRSADQLFAMSGQATNMTRSAGRWAEDMERRENITANAKALAESGSADMQDRIAQLGAAQTRLAAAQDGTEVAAVNGLIAVNQANIQAHQAQIANLQLALAASDRTERQQAEQRQAQDASNLYQETRWAMESMPE